YRCQRGTTALIRFGRGAGRAPGPWGRFATGPTARHRPSLLDRGADHGAVFRPAAVVVAHVLQAQEVGQDEPRVARALADAAVGDRRPVRIDALLLQVNRPELVRRLERPARGDGGAPGDALGTRHVPAALGGLGHPRRGDHLPRVFVGA